MRVFRDDHFRPLDLLALGAGGHLAAACAVPGHPSDTVVWDLGTGDAIRIGLPPRRDHQPAAVVDFASDGRLLCGASGSVGFFDPSTGEVRGRRLGARATRYALGPGGGWVLATGPYAAERVSRWGLSEGPPVTFRRAWVVAGEGPANVHLPAVSPDGRWVAAVTGARTGWAPVRSWAEEVQVYGAETGTPAWAAPTRPTAPAGLVGGDVAEQLAFTADSRRLAIRFRDRTVRLLDAATGHPAGELSYPRNPYLTALDVHPAGPVATARNDGSVTFWDPDALRPVRSFDWGLGKLVSLAFSPDGNLAAAGTTDGRVVVWDVDL